MSKRRNRKAPPRSRTAYAVGGLVVITAVVAGYLLASGALTGQSATSTNSSAMTSSASTFSQSAGSGSKPIILYVNQGNGVVDQSNFGDLLSTATSHGFNTIFFQVYRSGSLLFTESSLAQFVAMAHGQGLKIFFALYFTNSTQTIPTSVYSDGEDGINLDMSTLPISVQAALLNQLSSGYSGTTAVTTTDFTLPLSPGILVLETYGTGVDQYIHPGVVASVGVFTTTSRQQYEQEFQYALDHSDGVMVFDYAGLLKAGY